MKRVLLPLLLSIFSCALQAQEKAVPEYTMKAAYLYNFAQLTEWPSQTGGASNTFNLCVVGQDEVVAALEPMRGRMVGGRALNPMRVTQIVEARQCHLLYVGEGDGTRGGRLIDALRGTAVLTVTDDPQVARSGTMLWIATEGKRLAFDVNVAVANRSQIKFSSKLLRLANRVIGE